MSNFGSFINSIESKVAEGLGNAGAIGSGLLNALGYATNFGPTQLLNSGFNLLTSNWDRANQFKWNEKANSIQRQFNAEQAQIARDWNAEMDNTKYQRQVVDMQAAGVNPALAMSGGVSTQAGSNAVASSGGSFNPGVSQFQSIVALKQMELENKNIQAQNDAIQADADLKKAQKDAIDIENGHKDEMLTTAINEANARIDKMLNETRTESYKQSLLVTERLLNEANITRINELLPFEKAYEDAKTESARADAAFALVKAASERELIDGGYFVSLAEEAGFKADISKSMSQIEANNKVISDLERARRTGKSPDGQDFYKNGVQKHIMTRIYEMRDLLGGFNGLGHISVGSSSGESSSHSEGSSSGSSSYTKN